MNYIVFDLEWNQSVTAPGKSENNELPPFEIIEIGAVKLGPELELKGMFSQLIKPQIYPELHQITKSLLGITEQDLEKGGDFATVYQEFIKFCGDDYIFCTWGDTDIFELLDNVRCFDVPSPFNSPILYLDIQRLYGRHNARGKKRKKLVTVINELDIKIDSEFHRAVNDAKYTAEIMRHMGLDALREEISIDTFFVPATRDDEVRLRGKDYTKYLSRSFTDRNELMADKEITSLRCPFCGCNCKRAFPWFLGAGKVSYYIIGSCKKHGMIKGKIKTKCGPEDTFFALKKVTAATPQDVSEITEKRAVKSESQRRKRYRRKLAHTENGFQGEKNGK